MYLLYHIWIDLSILLWKNFVCGAARTHIIPLPTQPKTPATDGRTRLERVEWHNGGLSATEAHHLCFVPLLYHTLKGLSRGFLASVDFTSSNYELERGWLLQLRVSILLHPTTNWGEVGYCISSWHHYNSTSPSKSQELFLKNFSD